MKTWLKLCALLLALCFVLPAVVACNGESTTESKSETVSESQSATEKPTETASETLPDDEEETDLVPEGAVCYVGVDENDMDRFYFTIEEAIEDNPDGCQIFMLDDYKMTGTIPENYPLTIKYLFCRVEINFTSGVICEYWPSRERFDRLYCSDYKILLSDDEMRPFEDPNTLIVWFFEETDGMQPGRYNLINKNADDENLDPDYEYQYCNGPEMFDVPYVCEANGLYYYTVQEAISNVKREAIEKPHLITNTIQRGPITTPIPPNRYMQLPYSWSILLGSFNRGATYDDDVSTGHGYNYYNDLDKLTKVASLDGTFAYIWTDFEGFLPGFYLMEEHKDGYIPQEEVWDEDEEYLLECDMNRYRLIYKCPISYGDVIDELADYGHIEESDSIVYLVLERDFYDLRAGVWEFGEVDTRNYGVKTYDDGGNVTSADLTLFHITWLGPDDAN